MANSASAREVQGRGISLEGAALSETKHMRDKWYKDEL